MYTVDKVGGKRKRTTTEDDKLLEMGGVKKHPYSQEHESLLGSGRVVLGHSLCSFRHSMLGKLSREDEAHSSLDLSG